MLLYGVSFLAKTQFHSATAKTKAHNSASTCDAELTSRCECISFFQKKFNKPHLIMCELLCFFEVPLLSVYQMINHIRADSYVAGSQ